MGLVVGLVKDKRGRLCVHSETYTRADFIRFFIALLRAANAIPHDFPFSSLQYLSNAEVYPHKDSNSNLSICMSFGNFRAALSIMMVFL